ncbi:DctP family TRAP transporter solute-binding subunit [Metasolibacillus sp. FSL K6-0083]|uniref:DctP family TRAP transporter solute-binding subunit n=1 Tax=Metasolibacillus sp. FSL K6-0083 TaxID=2921416 RepID=UPI00315A5887
MKYFITIALALLIILASIIGYRQNIFNIVTLPYDDEQIGLQEQIIIHFSHVVAENTPKGLAAAKFAELVKEKTNGRVLVQVYPNGILYNDETELQALQKNEVQMIAPTFSKMTDLLPRWQVLDLPFVFEDEQQIKSLYEKSELKTMLLDELEQKKIKGLDFWHNGFKQIAANEQLIRETGDFTSLRIRIMASDLLRHQFQLLDAVPITTSFGNVYYEIERKGVEAQENTISNIYSKGFHTYEKNITLSNHGILGYAVLMNESFWDSLDGEIQQHIMDALNEMRNWQFDVSVEINNDSLRELESLPEVNIYSLTAEEKTEWKERLAPIYYYYEKEIDVTYYKLLLEHIENN